jgi:hypothetical protein
MESVSQVRLVESENPLAIAEARFIAHQAGDYRSELILDGDVATILHYAIALNVVNSQIKQCEGSPSVTAKLLMRRDNIRREICNLGHIEYSGTIEIDGTLRSAEDFPIYDIKSSVGRQDLAREIVDKALSLYESDQVKPTQTRLVKYLVQAI